MKKTNLKKLLYVPFLYALLISNSFSADAYIEGHVGTAFIDDVSATLLPRDTGFNQNIGVESEYDDALSLGGEFGFTSVVPNSNIRVGFGVTTFEAELETLTASTSGTTFNGTTISGSLTFTRAQLLSVGADLDTDVRIFGVNTYYDLATNADFVPYVGLGLGLADIEDAEDNEFAASFMIGGRYMITDNAYIGAKGAYHYVLGITDEAGIEYDDITAWTINVVLGIEF